MESIKFSVGKEQLDGNLFFPKTLQPKNPGVLFIHGWESRQDRGFMLAEALQEKGFICMTFDLRGHGESEGNIEQISRKDSLNDVIAAYDLLAAIPEIDLENILVIGSSFGSYMGALLSSKRKIHFLILRVPANYRDTGFEEPVYEMRKTAEHIEWKSVIHDSSATEALRAIHSFPGKILTVESENDEIVPKAVIQSYAQAVENKDQLTHIVMRGATHSLSQDEPRQREYVKIVLNWLS